MQGSHLDASFAALADGTRRGVLEHLGRAECSITDLAEQFSMTLTGMRKHVGILEEAGLVTTKKVGRVRYCRIGARRLDEVATWIDDLSPAVGRAVPRAGRRPRSTATEGATRWTTARVRQRP
jgi:DNA-binding transcriptional ArsR family regulator